MLCLLVAISMNSNAQSNSVRESRSVSITNTEDGKVKLKVTTRKGDDIQSFEKTYESYQDMEDDPELEDYGISAKDLSFGGRSFSFGSSPNIFFNQGPGNRFWNDDEDDDDPWGGAFHFDFDIDSMMSQMDRYTGPNMFQIFPRGLMDADSMANHFNFGFNNGRFNFNGQEFMDIDSLRDALKDQFDDMGFDFDFDWHTDDEGHDSQAWSFFHRDDEDDEDRDSRFKVITRARVYIRSAREEDRKNAGVDQMEDLELKDINFYPNPSDGRFNVEVNTGNGGPLQVKIISPDGEAVYDQTARNAEGIYDFNIDISDERKGIYVMQIIQNNTALTKRVIIE